MSAANWGIGGGGGPKYFFSGPKPPPSFVLVGKWQGISKPPQKQGNFSEGKSDINRSNLGKFCQI